MVLVIIAIGLALMVLERVFPDQTLTPVPGWWKRVFIINCGQTAVVLLGGYTWDTWFHVSVFHLSRGMNPVLAGFIGYLAVTFVFYWWHRVRHDFQPLWLAFHQIHHSASRIETITSFFKHPLEITLNSIIIAATNYAFLGIDLEAGAWCLLFSALGEFFYHMNIKTPHWVGYVFQRPEMHRIHHQRGKHYQNFSDIPLWDMLFGTFNNPKTSDAPCGFKPEREAKFWHMLGFQDVNTPLVRQES